MDHGRWNDEGDQTCGRIGRLTNGVLNVIQDHPNAGGWQRLFRDGVDGRYWERYYPQGELHSGGPPAPRLLTAREAAAEYGIRD